ncbi:TPA: phage tail protein [Escherichia coli]|nr:phage tail protein [Escherichia coli]HBA3809584.1 phage tail protein [Escherichia coli]
MAGTNDFKAFATDTDANVTSQEEWEALTALKKGFSSGKASSAQVSKALRQPSTMAAVLGQFIANAELDALDDGDVDGLVAKLATAITTNLGLGEAATRNVGTDTGQVPDISAWKSGPGWRKAPDGTIEQWGIAIGDAYGNATVYYPIAFSSRPNYVGFCNLQSGVPSAVQNVVINNDNFDYAGFSCRNLAFNGTVISGSASSFIWFARGK